MYKITLNTNKEAFYNLPGRFNLNIDNPGPITFDASICNQNEINWLLSAKNEQILFIESLNLETKKVESKTGDLVTSNFVPPTPIPNKPIAKTKDQIAKELLMKAEEDRKARTLLAKKILSSSAFSMSKEIASSTDIQLIKDMIGLEIVSKSRNKVLDQLQGRLNSLQASIIDDIGTEDIQDKIDTTLPEVDFIEEKTVTIERG